MFILRASRISCLTTKAPLSKIHLSSARFSRRTATANAMTDDIDARADAVLKYWFDDEYASWPKGKLSEEWFSKWFGKSDTTDQKIKDEFEKSVEAMRSGAADGWLARPLECLAGIILMDQFTRNIYRGTPDMYCLDDKAKQWAAHLASDPAYLQLHPAQRMFVWLPFMHGETMADQEQCMELCTSTAEECTAILGEDHPLSKMMHNCVQFGQSHLDIVAKYGRFPHRNELLGRESTEEEKAGLADGSIESF